MTSPTQTNLLNPFRQQTPNACTVCYQKLPQTNPSQNSTSHFNNFLKTDIIHCQLCKSVMHRFCYNPGLGNQDFICDVCIYNLKNQFKGKRKCCVCKGQDFGMKIVGNSSKFKASFGHVICLLFSSYHLVQSYKDLSFVQVKKVESKQSNDKCKICRKFIGKIYTCFISGQKQKMHWKCLIQNRQKSNIISNWYNNLMKISIKSQQKISMKQYYAQFQSYIKHIFQFPYYKLYKPISLTKKQKLQKSKKSCKTQVNNCIHQSQQKQSSIINCSFCQPFNNIRYQSIEHNNKINKCQLCSRWGTILKQQEIPYMDNYPILSLPQLMYIQVYYQSIRYKLNSEQKLLIQKIPLRPSLYYYSNFIKDYLIFQQHNNKCQQILIEYYKQKKAQKQPQQQPQPQFQKQPKPNSRGRPQNKNPTNNHYLLHTAYTIIQILLCPSYQNIEQIRKQYSINKNKQFNIKRTQISKLLKRYVKFVENVQENIDKEIVQQYIEDDGAKFNCYKEKVECLEPQNQFSSTTTLTKNIECKQNNSQKINRCTDGFRVIVSQNHQIQNQYKQEQIMNQQHVCNGEENANYNIQLNNVQSNYQIKQDIAENHVKTQKITQINNQNIIQINNNKNTKNTNKNIKNANDNNNNYQNQNQNPNQSIIQTINQSTIEQQSNIPSLILISLPPNTTTISTNQKTIRPQNLSILTQKLKQMQCQHQQQQYLSQIQIKCQEQQYSSFLVQYFMRLLRMNLENQQFSFSFLQVRRILSYVQDYWEFNSKAYCKYKNKHYQIYYIHKAILQLIDNIKKNSLQTHQQSPPITTLSDLQTYKLKLNTLKHFFTFFHKLKKQNLQTLPIFKQSFHNIAQKLIALNSKKSIKKQNQLQAYQTIMRCYKFKVAWLEEIVGKKQYVDQIIEMAVGWVKGIVQEERFIYFLKEKRNSDDKFQLSMQILKECVLFCEENKLQCYVSGVQKYMGWCRIVKQIKDKFKQFLIKQFRNVKSKKQNKNVEQSIKNSQKIDGELISNIYKQMLQYQFPQCKLKQIFQSYTKKYQKHTKNLYKFLQLLNKNINNQQNISNNNNNSFNKKNTAKYQKQDILQMLNNLSKSQFQQQLLIKQIQEILTVYQILNGQISNIDQCMSVQENENNGGNKEKQLIQKEREWRVRKIMSIPIVWGDWKDNHDCNKVQSSSLHEITAIEYDGY